MLFWSFLDVIFTFVDLLFTHLFDAIPVEAIPFLIGIFCYSVCAFFVFFIDRAGPGSGTLLLKLFYYGFMVIMTLFTVWRLGFIVALDYVSAEVSVDSLATFFVNLIYILFALVLFIAFYRKMPWLKKAIIVLLWSMFLLLTFIICPAMSWQYSGDTIVFTELTSSTLMQVLIVASIFIVPQGMTKLKKAKTEGVDE